MIFIVPSRERPDNVRELIEVCERTRVSTRLFFAVNDDDPRIQEYHKILYNSPDWVSWLRVHATNMVEALNAVADRVAPNHDVVGFMGDDHRPRSAGWDTYLRQALERKPGVAWGNDLIQGSNLPTHVAITAKIVARLHRMAPPTLTHLYVDNYWKALGEAVGTTYLPGVIIEHMHPIAGKAEWDEGYKRVNDGGMYAADASAFTEWCANGSMDDDIRRAKVAISE